MPLAPLFTRLMALLAGIHGTVRPAGELAPAVGVHVMVDGVDRAVTDSGGRYALPGVAAGQHQMRFVSPGFEVRQLTVLLADSSDLALDVELNRRAVVLPPIAVVAPAPRTDAAGRVPTTEWYEAGHYRLAPRWQTNQPAGGVDVQEALARVPGVATRGDNVTALSVHGSRGSENSLLLDGIPLFGAVHFAGASSAVNPDAIAAIDLHTGVSSARFGGALSGVIELETGEALEGGQLSAALSAADVRSTARTALGAGGGLLLSARSSFRNLMTDGIGLGAANGYRDFLAVTRVAIGSGSLRILGFQSSNHLHWEAAPEGTAGTVQATPPAVMPTAADAANWESTALGATWTQPSGPAGQWHAAGWWSGAGATITTIATDRSEQLASTIGEFGLSGGWSQRVLASTVTFGGEVTRPATRYVTSTSFTQAGVTIPGVALSSAPVIGAAWGEWDWHGGASIDLRAGLRSSTDFRRSPSVDPRLLVNVRADATTRIEFAFGRTHQFVQSVLNEDNLMSSIVGPALLAATPGSRPAASAVQWLVGVERVLGDGVTLALDGYARRWSNVLAPAVTTSGFFVTTTPAFGDGAARGLTASLSVVREQLAMQVSAGVASTTQEANGVRYPSGFERPWNFAGDVSYRLPARTTLQLRWNTGAGEPATAVLPGIEWRPYQPATGTGEVEGSVTNLGGAVNGLRLAGSMRIDVGARREWRLGAGGRAGEITAAVRLQNLFNRVDPVGIMAAASGALQLLPGTPRGLTFEVGWAH